MTLQSINIPDEIRELSLATDAADLIDRATKRIEAFMLERDSVTENFVRCDWRRYAAWSPSASRLNLTWWSKPAIWQMP
jgi:hypothetical protein